MLFVAQTPSKGIIQSVISIIRSAVSHIVSFVKKVSLLWRRAEPEVSQVDDFPAALFVNRKSGGKDGKALLKSLYKHINKQFICDVLHEGPHKRLSQALRHHWERHGLPSANHTAAGAPLLPVICCGGDGTIRWIMDEAHAHGHSQFCSFGIMPMGTGNDLFNHVLSYVADRQQASRLATQLSPSNQIHQTLRALSTFDMTRRGSEARANSTARSSAAYTVDFDRWQISVSAHPLSRSARLREKLRSSLAQSSASLVRRLRVTSRRAKSEQRNESDGALPPQSAPSGPVRSRIAFNNYFGIGIDGDITCAFDNLRKQRPQWFFHRLINKAWYGVVWTYKFCRGNAKNLSRDIDIYVDGQKLNTSALDLRGVILPNIASYAGGTRLWSFAGEELPPHGVLSLGDDAGAALRRWQSQSSEDGLLEVRTRSRSLCAVSPS